MATIKMDGYEDIIYEKRDGAAWMTINRPKSYNSLVARTVLELTGAITDAAEDPEIGVVVITGTGEKAFSSGGHVGVLGAQGGAWIPHHRFAKAGALLDTYLVTRLMKLQFCGR